MNIDYSNIVIDRNRVLKFLGYSTKVPPKIILKKLDEEIDKVNNLLNIEIIAKKLDIIMVTTEFVILEDGTKILSKYAANEFKNSNSVYLVLYTIGELIEEKIKEYTNSAEMIRAIILDKIGIVALDFIKEKIKESIRDEIVPFNISSELYPSQRDFSISNQQTIYNILKSNIKSINISNSYQLSPIKSVAVIFGIGNNKCSYTMCDRCDNKCSWLLIVMELQ